jgi:hypothetical protein
MVVRKGDEGTHTYQSFGLFACLLLLLFFFFFLQLLLSGGWTDGVDSRKKK